MLLASDQLPHTSAQGFLINIPLCIYIYIYIVYIENTYIYIYFSTSCICSGLNICFGLTLAYVFQEATADALPRTYEVLRVIHTHTHMHTTKFMSINFYFGTVHSVLLSLCLVSAKFRPSFANSTVCRPSRRRTPAVLLGPHYANCFATLFLLRFLFYFAYFCSCFLLFGGSILLSSSYFPTFSLRFT